MVLTLAVRSARRPFTQTLMRAWVHSTSNSNHGSISPYRVFDLPRHASEKEIRTRFRELAYRLHPDLNQGDEEELTLSSGNDFDEDFRIGMADVVEAYEKLLSSAGAGGARDSRVGSSVEKFTIRELMDDEEHTVIPITLIMDVLLEAGSSDKAAASSNDTGGVFVGKQRAGEGHVGGTTTDLSDNELQIHASGFDAVADLKRDLQTQFGAAWDLDGRRLDQENVAIGWELVYDGSVLCPNFFLEDYGIGSGDTIHAVIRDYPGHET